MGPMTPRQRMLTAMRNGIPDRVPVAPDTSNMIPCRLTGKPFWDIYLYQDPPLWQAYIDAAKYFGIDGWIYNLDGFRLPDPNAPEPDPAVVQETMLVERTAERLVTRSYTQRPGQEREWSPHVTVYPRYDPPTTLLADKVGMVQPPERPEPIEGVKPQAEGFDLLREGLERFEEGGVIGVMIGPPQLGNPESGWGYSVYDYYDRYDEVKTACREQHQDAVAYLRRVLAGPVRPDFILTGGSGMLVFNTPDIIRDLTLPALQDIAGPGNHPSGNVCRRVSTHSWMSTRSATSRATASCARSSRRSSTSSSTAAASNAASPACAAMTASTNTCWR